MSHTLVSDNITVEQGNGSITVEDSFEEEQNDQDGQNDVSDSENVPNVNTLTSPSGPVIVSELLCYATFYMHRSSPENIKKILLSSFTPEEILEAKKALWCEHNRPHLKKFQTRRTTAARHCSESNLNDIFEALFDLDVKASDSTLKFVALDLMKLPSTHPEELNELSLLKKIELLEKKFDVLENSVVKSNVHCEMVDGHCEKIQQQLATHEHLIGSFLQGQKSEHNNRPLEMIVAAEIHNGDVDGDNDEEWVTDDSDDSSGESGDSSGEASSSEAESDDTSEDSDDEDDSDPSSQSCSSDSDVSDDSEASENDRLTIGCAKCRHNHEQLSDPQGGRAVVNGNRSNLEQQAGNKRSYKSVVVGNGSQLFRGTSLPDLRATSHISGRRSDDLGRTDGQGRTNGQGRTDGHGRTDVQVRTDVQGFRFQRHQLKRDKRSSRALFIFNVPKSCAVSDVRHYVEERNVRPLDIFQRSHPEARRKSFVIRLDSREAQRLLRNTFWPSGVKVREYDSRS